MHTPVLTEMRIRFWQKNILSELNPPQIPYTECRLSFKICHSVRNCYLDIRKYVEIIFVFPVIMSELE